jgi:two-component system sensor histidine kinase PilS (NtrC family)
MADVDLPEVSQVEDERLDPPAWTGLGGLLGARLLLAGLSLGLAVTLDRMEGGQGHAGIWGVYWTVIAAFTATIVSALMVTRTRNPWRFATLQIGIDIAIVTSLVYFSGGSDSVFTFLYALVILYGALFLDRNGVVVSAGLAAACYGFVVFGSRLGWLPTLGLEQNELPLPVLAAYWGFYAGALLVLGMLANTLSAELHRTGAALDRRTDDLRRLRDLHLRTLESIGSGILTTSSEGRVTSFNPEAERITGVAAKDALGRVVDELIPGAQALVEASIADQTRIRPGGRDRIAFRRSPHDDRFLGMAASALRDEAHQELGRVVIFQDVTKVVSMENELRQSERLAAVGEMAARIAHEIRNPLASISGSVQILQSAGDAMDSSPEQQRLMGIVVREVDRLNELIGDFLLYSRPAPLRPERVSLGGLVQEIAEMSEAQSSADVNFELDLDPEVEVMADPALLKAVFWNLWNNAIEALDGKGTVSARVLKRPGDLAQDPRRLRRNGEETASDASRASEGIAVFEVEDTGPGIAPEVREMIFEPFFTTKREGTGLGLATVQRIVEQHGGMIQASSEPGRGACFRVLLECTRSQQ